MRRINMNFLEIQFSLRGRTLPSDHGYALYSALKSGILKDLQQRESELSDLERMIWEEKTLPQEVLVSSIPGVPDRDGMIYLNRGSRFRLRCPADQVQLWYRLLQKSDTLDIRGHLIRLVQPKLTLPDTSEALKARIVTFKLKEWHIQEAPLHFLESCQKALEALEIQARPFIDSGENGDLAKRSLYIKDKHIMGFGVVVEGLKPEDSLKLQGHGLGGRKHFGCGWFYPVKENYDAA
jgi:CRISPR-associated protein Cas6